MKRDALLIEDPIDLYYLTGLELSAGQLLVKDDESVLYVDGRYLEEAKSRMKARLGPAPLKGKVEFDATKTSFQRYLDLCSDDVELVPIKGPTKRMRLVKNASEIEKLKRAAELGRAGFEFLTKQLALGKTERQLVAELEIFWLQNGAAGVAFSPIVAFGENSSKPHYHPQDRPLREDDAVLIDIGVTLDHYHSDMTRVLLPKDPDPKMVEIYAVVKEAQKRALALCKPKSVVADLDAAARDYITECGYGDHFVHSLGHGIGLEVHEAPRLYKEGADVDLRLEAGMAITIEPGIYLPGIGGVRIEDTVVITNEGHINLTNSPK